MAITVNRKPLTFWEKLYLPAIVGGLKVTLKHAYSTLIQRKVVTMEYPEQKWTLPADYRGAPYLVKDQEGNTKCVSCQLCEFVCPPKAIRITPPGEFGQTADRTNAEKMPQGIRDQHAALHLLRLLPGSLPGRGDFLAEGLFAHRPEPRRNDLQQGKTPVARRHQPAASRNGNTNWKKRRRRKAFP